MKPSIQQLITKGRIEKALEQALQWATSLKAGEFERDLIALSARYNKNERKNNQGVLSPDIYTRESNQIIHSLQSLLQEMEEEFPHHAPSPQHSLRLWILSTTKTAALDALPAHLQPDFPHHRYHDDDCRAWQPFEEESETINHLVEAFKQRVQCTVEERFLEQQPYPASDQERLDMLPDMEKVVLIVDPLALHGSNIGMMADFDDLKIGSCLVVLCKSSGQALFDHLCTQLQEAFKKLYICFVGSKQTIHFLFPISTKELLLRLLTNLDVKRLQVATTIQGTQSQRDQQLRTQNFTI
jgi:hypothetical protein